MPYSTPQRPAHPRSRSTSSFFSKEHGPGAFVSLGSLPKRTKHTAPKRQPVFHINDDADEGDGTSPTDDDDEIDDTPPTLNSLSLSPIRLGINVKDLPPPLPHKDDHAAVPFPLTAPLSSSPQEILHPSHALSRLNSMPRSTSSSSLSRTNSSPILLSNGKPLKSSLKSCSSSSSISDSHHGVHLRAQSAPSTPHFPPKNVHFAEKDEGLESVRVFSRSAKPLSITTGGDDTETETEPETFRPCTFGRYDDAFPFPRLPAKPTFELDLSSPDRTSPIPSLVASPYANVHIESITLTHSPATSHLPLLTGTLVVRNLGYHKHVAVRFTLDGWHTTSEVSARHIESLETLPAALAPRTLGDAISAISTPQTGSAGDKPGPLWDRFGFAIRLEDYAHNLQDRVLWLVARYTTPVGGGGEWWDNNGGRDYRVMFRIKREDKLTGPAFGRKTAVSAPPVPPSTLRPPSIPLPPVVVPTTASTVPFPMSTPELPSSPPTHRAGVLSSTTNRLSKLHFMNYAAPTSPVGSSSSGLGGRGGGEDHGLGPPLLSPRDFSEMSGEVKMSERFTTVMINGHPATAPVEVRTGRVGGRMGTRNHVRGGTGMGIGLHWPWGSLSDVRLNVVEGGEGGERALDDLAPAIVDEPGKDAFSAMRLRPPSPPKQKRGSPSGSSSSSPCSSRDPSPPRRRHTPPQNGSLFFGPPSNPRREPSPPSHASDTLYDAILKKWCFAQSPPPGAHSVSASPPLGLSAV